MKEEMHGTTSRYYPVTHKDQGRETKKHNYCEHSEEGMDTHNTTHRYVPAQSNFSFFSHMFHGNKHDDGGMDNIVTPEDDANKEDSGNIDA